jgi:hemerythrin-like domain-containing protein
MTSATELLRFEHRSIELSLERFEAELRDPQGKGLHALAQTFAEIQQHLSIHFRHEEETFYPALAPLLAPTDGAIAQLTGDHSDTRETSATFQRLLEQALATENPALSLRAELATTGWTLWNLIHHHIAEEEAGLLAFADRQLDSTTQARLAERMKAQP